MSTTGIRLLSGGGSLGSVPMPSSTVRCADPPHPDVSDRAKTVHILKSNRVVLRIGAFLLSLVEQVACHCASSFCDANAKIARSARAPAAGAPRHRVGMWLATNEHKP